jgi:hypothetical protein
MNEISTIIRARLDKGRSISDEDVLRLLAERDALQAENARMRKLAAYLAGTNTDHVQVALAGNLIVCDAIYAEARAALGETQ